MKQPEVTRPAGSAAPQRPHATGVGIGRRHDRVRRFAPCRGLGYTRGGDGAVSTVGSRWSFWCGLGVAAYTLGLRHAFDADHIAAIDNITRKLCVEGRRRMSVGFWFSLGHSSIVFGMCALLAAGIRNLADNGPWPGSELHSFFGLFGHDRLRVFLCCALAS